jgi:putative transcriptional regulator
MPIRVQLDRVLLERRMSLTELADRVGVTIANLSILKTGKARAVRFSTLAALPRAGLPAGRSADLRGGSLRRPAGRRRARITGSPHCGAT